VGAAVSDDEPCHACATGADVDHAIGCEREYDYMRLKSAAIDATPEADRAAMWFSMWWRVCRPANSPLLPRWAAPRAWRRHDRAERHWLLAGDRGVSCVARAKKRNDY
jgi:hypothetical protein